jgi:hypothetical protein
MQSSVSFFPVCNFAKIYFAEIDIWKYL